MVVAILSSLVVKCLGEVVKLGGGRFKVEMNERNLEREGFEQGTNRERDEIRTVLREGGSLAM